MKTNDLSKWEQYGGNLLRPPPPTPTKSLNMENPSTKPQNELNDFTSTVKYFFGSDNIYGRTHYKVELRDGTHIQPIFMEAEDETCEDHFEYKNGDMYYCWNLDGTSVTSSDYDMMVLVYDDIS